MISHVCIYLTEITLKYAPWQIVLAYSASSYRSQKIICNAFSLLSVKLLMWYMIHGN